MSFPPEYHYIAGMNRPVSVTLYDTIGFARRKGIVGQASFTHFTCA
jgi:hypothetical protein